MPSFSDITRRSWLRGLLLGVAAFWLVAPLSFLPLGQFLENRALDFCYQWRPLPASVPDILLVGIDEASFQELRQSWPWPRSWHARLVQRLTEAGAGLIVFDIVFAEPSRPEDDAAFTGAIQATGNVVLAKTLEVVEDRQFRRQIVVSPLPELAAAARGVGLAMVTPDLDGVVRRFQVQLAGQETIAAVAAGLFKPGLALPPILAGLIDYAGGARSLDTVSYYQVIDPERPVPRSRIEGKIVLVGRMLEAGVNPQGQADSFYTPHFSLTGQTMSGVEIQGHIIQTLLKGSWGRPVAASPRILIFLGVFLAAAYLFARLSPLPGFVGLFILLALLGAGTVYLFFSQRLWFPPVLLAGGLLVIYGGNALCHYFLAAQDKRWLRQAFSRYVSPSLVELIGAHPERLRLGGEKVELTVLFSDLAGFTGISERLTPEELIGLLNEYFSTMTDVILQTQGTVDKFIGDAIMAFWGAPLPIPDHPRKACQAALGMKTALASLQRHWQAQGLPRLDARLGLHTGPAIVGNVGSRQRFNYTVMGDTVNLASRLEGVNKVYGTSILVSETTYREAGADFLCREIDLVQVKGRHKPVSIYELLGRREDGGQFPWLEAYTGGLQAYRRQEWERAEGLFQAVLGQQPADSPTLCLLHRLQHFQQHPPPDDWDGTFHLDSK